MSKKTLLLILGLFSILTFWGMFNNPHHLIVIFIIILGLILNNHFKDGRGGFFLWLSIFAIIYLILSNPFFFVGLILLVVYITNNHPELSALFQTVFSEKSKKTGKSDFIIVDFNESDQIPNKIKKNKWFGNDKESSKSVYSWEDTNYTKLIGNSVFDLANTLLPREQNVILVRQGIGNVKILIPEGTAVSIDFSGLIGKFLIDESEYYLLNENYKWYSDNYLAQDRKVKVVVNLLVGNLEVVFL